VLLQTMPSFSSPQVAGGGDTDAPAGAARSGSVIRAGATSEDGDTGSSSAALALAGGGRALGGATRRGGNAADARSARLQALERNASEESNV
jgi:hypothetical protein